MKHKEKAALVPKTDSLTPTVLSDKALAAMDSIKDTDTKIKKGLSIPTASTGTPIDALSGGARFLAQLSNIGEGSLEVGGGGIKEGFNTIIENVAAKSAFQTELQQTPQKALDEDVDD